MIHRKLGTKRPTYCTLYISRVQSYNFFAIFAIARKCFLQNIKTFLLRQLIYRPIFFTHKSI